MVKMEDVMTIAAIDIAKKICELSDWTVSNLQLQKLIYLAHMIYIGRHEVPLIDQDFEAWNYGPVVPELYQQFKIFGDKPIRNIFNWDSASFEDREETFLQQVWENFKNKTPGQLVAITHKENGAWHKNYTPGRRGTLIPYSDILSEYKMRNAKH